MDTDLLANYIENNNSIKGWFLLQWLPFFQFFDCVQRARNVSGGTCEIGVHHGKSFIPLAIVKSDFSNLAIDVFEDQELNLDKSGLGSLESFKNNLKNFCPGIQIFIKQGDSNFVSTEFIQKWRDEHKAISIFSIDGSHTAEATFSDLLLAEKFCQNGSIILLDDYYNQDWPGVHEGFIKYLHSGLNKFRPLMYGFNKMALVDHAFSSIWHDAFKNEFIENPKHRIKNVFLCGYPFYSVR